MPQDRRLSDVVRQLEQHGWTFVRYSKDAHAVFDKDGKPLLVVPVKKKKVKACYAKRIQKACDE